MNCSTNRVGKWIIGINRIENYLSIVIILAVRPNRLITYTLESELIMAKSKSKSKDATLKPIIRLAVKSEDSESNSQFGRGVANLCLGVRELGSLNAAAKSMKMAYSKAWRIIKETEAALGMQLLDRDGAHGSTLTENGAKLLDAYLDLDAKLQKVAEDEFAKRFK